MEAAIFAGFIGLQFVIHFAGNLKQSMVWVQHLSKNHYLIWIFHPAILHGTQDFLIHLVDVTVHSFH